MAGHRRAKGQPLRPVGRLERLRAETDQRLLAAQKPTQRVSIAADYLRAVLARAPLSTAEQVSGSVVHLLLSEADRLATTTPALSVATSERKAS